MDREDLQEYIREHIPSFRQNNFRVVAEDGAIVARGGFQADSA